MSLTVLVTGDHAQTAISVMDSLTDKPLALFACDGKSPCATSPWASELPEGRRYVVHGCDSPEFIGDLLALCERCQVDLLVPAGAAEASRVARVRDLFEQLGTKVLIAAPESFGTAAGRDQLARMCCRTQSWLRARATRLASWAGIALAA